MSKEETYVPLEKSAFWNDVAEKEKKDGALHPTKLHVLDKLLLSHQGFYLWSAGRVVPDKDCKGAWSPPYRNAELDYNASPDENPLFADIPTVKPDQFLKELDDERKIEDLTIAEISDNTSPKFNVMTDNSSRVCYMPLDIDVHCLAAAMMMLKQVYLQPGRLDDRCITKDKQVQAVRKALNVGFGIIAKRGIEGDFAKSCAEFSQRLPSLTTFSETYLQHADRRCERLGRFKKRLDKRQQQSGGTSAPGP